MTPIALSRRCLRRMAPLACFTLLFGVPLVDAHEQDASTHRHAQEERHDDHHLSELDGLRVLHGWANATARDIAHVYMELENTGGKAVTITGVSAELAECASLIGFCLVNGEATHEPIHAIPVEPGRSLPMTPDGLAIKLTGLAAPLEEGKHFSLMLETDQGSLEVHIDVEAAQARQHSHAGHAH